MAISNITGGTLVGAAPSGADITLTFPTLQEDDVVFVCAARANGGPSVNSAGWGSPIGEADSSGHIIRVWRKVMGASPDTTVNIEGGGSTLTAMTAIAFCLRGVDPDTPEDATPTTATGNSTNPDPASIGTVTDNAWVLALASSNNLDASVTAPSGYSNLIGEDQSDTLSSSTHGATRQVSPAATENPGAFGNWSTGAWGAVTVAVRPAGAAAVAARPVVFVCT